MTKRITRPWGLLAVLALLAIATSVVLNPGDSVLVSCPNTIQVTRTTNSANVICPANTSTRTPTSTRTSTATLGPTITPTITRTPTNTSIPPTPTDTSVPTLTPLPTSSPTATDIGGSSSFLETFDGVPVLPLAWHPANWDVTVHQREFGNSNNSTFSMMADHGPMCEAPPITHQISTYVDSVFICNGHVMTAINGDAYGAIYLTPDSQVDFSGGTAVIKFDVSTLRKSGRDWIDLWVTPFSENLQAPLQSFFPDLQGPPKEAVHIVMRLGFPSSFEGEVYRNFDNNMQSISGSSTGYESMLAVSAATRTTFELDISKTHLKFGMPQYNFWWIDQNISSLPWDRGVVQIGHHSYDPQKDCGTVGGQCLPNTWHWDNVSISPAIPFTIDRANQLYANQSVQNVTLNAPTLSGSFLRFSGIGSALAFSTDGGSTWTNAQQQVVSENIEEHFKSYWTPIPEGVTQIKFRGQTWWGGDWQARDISVWSLSSQ